MCCSDCGIDGDGESETCMMCLPLMCLLGYCCCRGKDTGRRSQYVVPPNDLGYGYQQSGGYQSQGQHYPQTTSYQNQQGYQQTYAQNGYNIIPQPGYPPQNQPPAPPPPPQPPQISQ